MNPILGSLGTTKVPASEIIEYYMNTYESINGASQFQKLNNNSRIDLVEKTNSHILTTSIRIFPTTGGCFAMHGMVTQCVSLTKISTATGGCFSEYKSHTKALRFHYQKDIKAKAKEA